MYIVRPVQESDIDCFLSLAKLTGAGFTSLSIPKEDIIEKISSSIESFHQDIKQPGGETYILVLEDIKSKQIVGMSAIKTGVGLEKPFFNFRIIKRTQYSKAADKYFNIDVMVLVNDFINSSEVSMLFVHPKYRTGGSGHLISQARYMMIAACQERFNEIIISELRGVVDQAGRSLFWQEVGQKFFDMSFNEADSLNAKTDNQFIVDLMPRFPIYLNLLSGAVVGTIGKTHPEGVGALKLLEREGFVYDNVVDIFDAGPLVSCPKKSIRTVRDSFQVSVYPKSLKGIKNIEKGIISTDQFKNLKIAFAEFFLEENIAYIEPEIYEALSLNQEDKARVWIRK